MANQKRLDSWRNQSLKSQAALAVANAVLDDIYRGRLTHEQIREKIRAYKRLTSGGLLKIPEMNPNNDTEKVSA